MSTYYIDTSAAMKLLAVETHSRALTAFYDEHARSAWVSSALLRIELLRSVRRVLPDSLSLARELLNAFDTVPIDDKTVDAAAAEPDPALRSLDAIHLATARLFGESLDALVTYDDRMTEAARRQGVPVLAPHDEP